MRRLLTQIACLRTTRVPLSGFSLVETALALGILSFAVLSLLGLFLVSVETNQESMDRVKAANLAANLVSQRRSSPVSTDAAFWLPELVPAGASQETTGTLYADVQNQILSAPGGAYFKIDYRYLFYPDAAFPSGVDVFLSVQWPALAPAEQADRYELKTSILLQ